jgi:hypothetical protein
MLQKFTKERSRNNLEIVSSQPCPVGIFTTFMSVKTIDCKSTSLPLLLERRIKSTGYFPLIPAFSLKGEGVATCVDTAPSTQLRAGLCRREREEDVEVTSCPFLS